MEYPITQSAWRRGWNGTKTAWKSLPFIILDTVVCVVIGAVFEWYWGLGLFIFAMLCAWIGATASAPVRQRNEARKHVKHLESELGKPKLFDVVCQTTSLGLPINRLDDGSYRASAASVGFSPILIAHRGELTNVTRLTASPEVRFTRADNQRWETTNAIQVTPGSNPLAGPGARDFTWDIDNPQQWVLRGLPLAMAKDELLQLPMMKLTVVDGNNAGTHFENKEICTLIVRLAVRTDKGSPPLPDQVITLTRSDIKDSLI